MKPSRGILGSAALVLFLVLCTGLSISFQASGGPSLFQDPASNPAAWKKTMMLACLMIVGIILGRLHARLAQLPGTARINIVGELRRVAETGGFWRSLLTAPIVFGVTYSMSQNQPDPIVAGVLALENGFFCDVLFKRREDEGGTETGQGSPIVSGIKQAEPLNAKNADPR